MEPACHRFELSPPQLSPVPPRFTRPASLFSYSRRTVSSNLKFSKNSRVSCSSSSSSRCRLQVKADSDGANETSDSKCLVKSIGRGLIGFAAAAAAFTSVCSDSPALAESLTVAFPASRIHEVTDSVFGFPFPWIL